MEPTWILPLDAGEMPLPVAGGKGANLARIVTQGFPVPAGFLVTTAAYQAYVAHNDLGAFILSTLACPASLRLRRVPDRHRDALQAEDPAALAAASQAIRARFAAGTIPPALETALLEAYAGLDQPSLAGRRSLRSIPVGPDRARSPRSETSASMLLSSRSAQQLATPVAVRSSATAEDLPELSFAGQQDTTLNVVGQKALLAAVVNCWSSLWTARAIGYRARQGISHHDLALAVVVQEMVPSEASGVLFTADPLSGKRTEMVIEATLGLGEALVSGQIEPDRYRVETGSGRVLDKTLGAKALSIRGQDGGGTVTRTEDAAALQALPDAAIADLAHLGRRVAEFFGTPQDVEWAWAGGRLYLLQSRPITALFPVPAGTAPEPLQVFLSFGAIQGVLGPITPLGQDAIRGIFAGFADLFGYETTWETQRTLSPAAERLFANFTGLIRHRLFSRIFRALVGMIEPGAAQAMASLWDDPRLAPNEGLNLRMIRRLAPLLLFVIPRFIRSFLRPEAERARFEQELESLIAGTEARMAATVTLAERLALTEELLTTTLRFLLPRFVSRFGPSMAGLNLLDHLAAGLPEGQHNSLAMTRGLPHNVTTEMDLALWATAQRIKADPAALAHFQAAQPNELTAGYLATRLPEESQAAVADFLRRYGMRGLGEIDLGRLRWREEPTPIMQVLQSYLQIEDPDQAPDVAFARGAAAAEAAIEELAEAVRQTRGGWLKARQVRWAARRLRSLAGLREMPKFGAVRMMGIVRAALLDSGQSLVADGVLEAPEDLFFLHLDELQSLARGQERDWKALVRERRQTDAREERRKQVPRLLLSDGQAFYEGVAALAEAGEGVLAGSPVSPGVVEGSVRIVLDPRGVQLAPGEILVCPGTDPAWTPLFLVAGGLVMEVGGLMTHGSVVAREYGIPAVVGVSQATTRLQTGQRVRIDGTKGRVEILDEPLGRRGHGEI